MIAAGLIDQRTCRTTSRALRRLPLDRSEEGRLIARSSRRRPCDRDNYLTHSRGISSWIFTLDHKRIGVMYLFSVLTAMFLGGLFAMLIRTQLLDPAGLLFHKTEVLNDSSVYKPYNQIFTLHGAIMIFLVLIPGTPAVLGNFVLPLMLGAKDVAFPRLNLASYYFYVAGTDALPGLDRHRRGRHGLDVLHAL